MSDTTNIPDPTPDRWADLRRLAGEATKGEWVVQDSRLGPIAVFGESAAGERELVAILYPASPPLARPTAEEAGQAAANASLVALARNSLAPLLAERNGLARRVAELEGERDTAAADCEHRVEAARLREALHWAVGFIRCHHPRAEADYQDMRNAVGLADGLSVSGEFHRLSCAAEAAELENARLREALRQLSGRHRWTPGFGACICPAHQAADKLLEGKADE